MRKGKVLNKKRKERKPQNCDLELLVCILKIDHDVLLGVFLYVNQAIYFFV